MVHRTYAIAWHACCMQCLHQRRRAHRNLTATTGLHARICTYIYECVCVCAHAPGCADTLPAYIHAWALRCAHIVLHTATHEHADMQVHTHICTRTVRARRAFADPSANPSPQRGDPRRGLRSMAIIKQSAACNQQHAPTSHRRQPTTCKR